MVAQAAVNCLVLGSNPRVGAETRENVMKIAKFDDGYVICADSTCPKTFDKIKELVGDVALIVADPPYGNIVKEKWDRVTDPDVTFVNWMIDWTKMWSNALLDNGAFYVWGGIGKPEFRPFLKYITSVEVKSKFELANIITWSKKRGYGVQNNYLFTREECAYFTKGNAKAPRTFNIPFLKVIRPYKGFNKKYPAKHDNYRRTNVWTDITEIMQGKKHPTQKQQRVIEIPIEIHTHPGEWVLDPFAGIGTTAHACRKLNRKFIVIESDENYFNSIVNQLANGVLLDIGENSNG